MRRFLLPTVFFAAIAAGCAKDGPSQPASAADGALLSGSAAQCQNVRGTLSGNVFVLWGIVFEGDISGPGTLTAAPQLDPRGRGAIHLATLHAIDTGEGIIFTTDQGVLAPVSPPVFRLNNRYSISGGTEDYEDASGFMHINAQLNIATGVIDGQYHGRVCR
jgi:hypothetical protein